jgi:hypothetical protein
VLKFRPLLGSMRSVMKPAAQLRDRLQAMCGFRLRNEGRLFVRLFPMDAKHLALLATVAGIAACSNAPDTASMGMSEARCRAAGAESVLGRTLDQQVLQEALMGSGGLRTRVIQPGSVVTQDHDPMRLNIEVDQTGRIRRMVCG